MARRHAHVVNLDEVESREVTKGDKFGFRSRRLGPEVGARAIGASHFEIPPGRQAFPQHFHTANEESVFVLEGSGIARIGQAEVRIAAGDYIALPVGPDQAHSIRNDTRSPLKLLCISTLHPVEIVGYPDSQKTAAFATSDASKGFLNGPEPWVRLLVRNQPSVDYYDGEL